MWSFFGFRKATATTLRMGYLDVKRRFYLGGDESRTARHEALWIAVLGVCAVFGTVLRFDNHSSADHIAGLIFMCLAAYVFLAFFLPLWLPRVRDAKLIKQRREADRVARENAEHLMARALQDLNERERGPESRAARKVSA